jgi:hypothetical protein
VEAGFVAGFVAAEGSFIRTHAGTRPRFGFAVALGATDAAACELLQEFFGVGHVRWYARRKEHYDDEVQFTVGALVDLVNVVVPFMDVHLPPCHKRTQYEKWRRDLLEYWDIRARRRRPCTVEGCDTLSRAKGLCRHHYYKAHGA